MQNIIKFFHFILIIEKANFKIYIYFLADTITIFLIKNNNSNGGILFCAF